MRQIFNKKFLQISAILILSAGLVYGILHLFDRKTILLDPSIRRLNAGNYSVEAEINKKKYLLKIDTGSEHFIALYKKVLKKIPNKKLVKSHKWMDANGNVYQSKIFKIDGIKFAKFEVTPAMADEENTYFMERGGHLRPDLPVSKGRKKVLKKISGRIGSALFINYNYWMIDLPNKTFFPIDNKEEMENLIRSSFPNFVRVPLAKSRHSLIIIALETDFGIKRFCLDTGTGRTILRAAELNNQASSHQKIITKKFIANEHDFGEVELYLFDFPQKIDFEGVIGLDFLEKRPFLLNFEDKEVLIGF